MGTPVGLARLLRMLQPQVQAPEDPMERYRKVFEQNDPSVDPGQMVDEQEMPAIKAYKELIAQGAPQYQAPKGIARAGTILSGALAGFTGRPNPVDSILAAPHARAVESYKNEESGLKTLAGLEAQENNQKRLTAQAEAMAADRKAEIARRDRDSLAADADRDLNRQRLELSDKENREERRRAAEESNQTRREIATLSAQTRRETSGGRGGTGARKANLQPLLTETGEATGKAWDPRSNEVVDMPEEMSGERLKALPPAENERRGKLKNLRDTVQSLKDAIDDPSNDFSGDLGPWDFLMNKAKRATVGLPNKTSTLYRNSGEALIQRIYAESGKAITQAEAERLISVVPQAGQHPDEFKNQVEEFLRQIDNLMGHQGIKTDQKSAPAKKTRSFYQGRHKVEVEDE